MDEVQTAPVASKLFGFGLACVTLACGVAAFYGAWIVVSHRDPMVQAARLGAVERHDTAWILGLTAVLVLAFAIILAAFGYGHNWRISRTWRRWLLTGAVLAALAPALSYGAGAGWRVVYVNGHERGLVTPWGVTHFPWTSVSSTEIACALGGGAHPDHAVITFKVAFPDGQADDFSFQLRRGVTGDMLDWDLWIAYQIRKAYWDDPRRPKPVIIRNPQCDWYFTIAASPEVRAKLDALFAPATSRGRQP